ncbi:MAG: OpgC family protein [Dichotomicrobium sp.]
MNFESAPAAQTRKPRDPRLDFFRGAGMFIIFIAHVPLNAWTLWIPARFGFSDATEIFVFCSGMASAIAFGRIFDDRGWWMGAARVSHRVWQVYWGHIALFLIVAAMMVTLDSTGWHAEANHFRDRLNLGWFFDNTATNLVGLLTLTYVPNYFDILPMYLVILALMPVVVLLGWQSRYLAAAFIAVVWLGANFQLLSLPAEPWSDRQWFFNPFAWQLVFFSGFAFIRGWIPAPPVDRRLVIGAIAVVVLTIPLAWFRIYTEVPLLQEWRTALRPLIAKTEFGILRYVHFLVLAYLAWVAAGEGGRRLVSGGLWGKFVRVVQKVGQQSLAVFLSSMVLAQFAGAVLDFIGRDMLTFALVNLTGCVILVGVAYTTAWYKSQPWRGPKPATLARPAEDKRYTGAIQHSPEMTSAPRD